MKVHQEFAVTEPVSAVWKFFGEPESVARCMPGVEQVTVLDDDNVQVRTTQSLRPMMATFEAKVTVLERVTDELIRSGRRARASTARSATCAPRTRYGGAAPPTAPAPWSKATWSWPERSAASARRWWPGRQAR